MNDTTGNHGRRGHIALFETRGPRREKHKVVLYIAVDVDWTSRNLDRNGNKERALAMAPMTEEAWRYRDGGTRACSLQYNGVAPADAEGLGNDLRDFGYDEETVARFLKAAEPCWD
jgi:hypothetical protein